MSYQFKHHKSSSLQFNSEYKVIARVKKIHHSKQRFLSTAKNIQSSQNINSFDSK